MEWNQIIHGIKCISEWVRSVLGMYTVSKIFVQQKYLGCDTKMHQIMNTNAQVTVITFTKFRCKIILDVLIGFQVSTLTTYFHEGEIWILDKALVRLTDEDLGLTHFCSCTCVWEGSHGLRNVFCKSGAWVTELTTMGSSAFNVAEKSAKTAAVCMSICSISERSGQDAEDWRSHQPKPFWNHTVLSDNMLYNARHKAHTLTSI